MRKRRNAPQSLELIAISFFFAFALRGLDSYLFVVFLQGCKILACFTKFSFLHALSNIPMHKGTLAVHEVKLVVNTREDFRNGGGVADHAASAHDLGQVTTGHDGWRLVVDAAFEACRRPIDELDGALCLDS